MADDNKVLTLKDEGPPEAPPPDPPKSLFERIKLLVYLAGAAVIFCTVFCCGFAATYVLTPEPEPVIPGGSIVVLPFTTGSPEVEHLAESFQSTLIEALSAHAAFVVTPEAAADAFAGDRRKLDAIGKELGVRYVVEGKVSRSADKVIVNATLIDADRGASVFQSTYSRSEVVPWSAMDGVLKDVLSHANVATPDVPRPAVHRVYTDEQYWERLAYGEHYCTQSGAVSEAAERARLVVESYTQAAAYAEGNDELVATALVKQAECALALSGLGALSAAEGKKIAHNALSRALQADEQLRTTEGFTALATKAGLRL